MKGSLPSKARGEKLTEKMWNQSKEIILLAIIQEVALTERGQLAMISCS